MADRPEQLGEAMQLIYDHVVLGVEVDLLIVIAHDTYESGYPGSRLTPDQLAQRVRLPRCAADGAVADLLRAGVLTERELTNAGVIRSINWTVLATYNAVVLRG